MSTIDTRIEERIEALAVEAAAAGDLVQVAICRRALGLGIDHLALSPEERRDVDAMTDEQALRDCAIALGEFARGEGVRLTADELAAWAAGES